MATRRKVPILCLLRCGETEWGSADRLRGATDLPLSTAGASRVSDDAARLTVTRLPTIYHAPDEAATATAKTFARALRARTRIAEDLADPDLGGLEGLSLQEFKERFPRRHKQWLEDPVTLVPPDGEEFREASARILGAVARIVRRTRGAEVGVVLHTIGTGLLRAWLADRPASDLWSLLDRETRVERYVMTAETIRELGEAARHERSLVGAA